MHEISASITKIKECILPKSNLFFFDKRIKMTTGIQNKKRTQ